MSFTGNLEDLSIVDVVQLLHATRKSGTLTVTGAGGASQLVLSDGFIVSASHFDDRLRIGAVLVEAGALAPEGLEEALAEQQAAGEQRRPLIATLVESGRVKQADAFRALEALIELTLVDILTWKTGSFSLDTEAVAVPDDYRHFPETLGQQVRFRTENLLMEALRIYDEKKRDGLLIEREPAAPQTDVPPPRGRATLSPGDLGLDDIERLERRIPDVFAPLEDRSPGATQREALRLAAPGLPEEELSALAAFLETLPPHPMSTAGLPLSAILLGSDALLLHCLAVACRHAGLAVFTTTDPGDVGPVADQQRHKGRMPILVVDRGEESETAPSLSRLSQLGTIELVPGPAEDAARIRHQLRRPELEGSAGSLLPPLVPFLEAFPAALLEHAGRQGEWVASAARRCAGRLREARSAAAIAQGVLASIAELGARALLLVVRGEELASSAGAGLHAPGVAPAAAPGLRIPLAQAPQMRQAVATGRCLIAPMGDDVPREILAGAISPAVNPAVLLVPLAAGGKTASVVYADFGAAPAALPPLDLLETFAAQAGAALELVLCRKRLEQPPR